VGRHDTSFKISTSKPELFNDTVADYEGTIGFDDHRADSTIISSPPTSAASSSLLPPYPVPQALSMET